MPLPKEVSYTYTDYLAWEGRERYELIDGVPRLMSPGPSRRHQEVCGEIFAQIHAYLKGKKCEVYMAPFDVRLFEEAGDRPEHIDTVVQPDLMVICDQSKLDDAGCKGAPDLVIEVLSPSTQRHDRVTKLNLYERAGVREYWIVDPQSQTIQTFLLEEGRYRATDLLVREGKLKVAVLEDCSIDLAEVFPQQAQG